MIPAPLFYQLLLGGLVLLWCMLHVLGPYDRAPSGPTPSCQDTTPALHRLHTVSRTHPAPPCAACEQGHAASPQMPCGPPPHLMPTRGRRRTVDTSRHFCPQPACTYRGWVGRSNYVPMDIPVVDHGDSCMARAVAAPSMTYCVAILCGSAPGILHLCRPIVMRHAWTGGRAGDGRVSRKVSKECVVPLTNHRRLSCAVVLTMLLAAYRGYMAALRGLHTARLTRS
jgi:hypothetical protein